MTLRNSCLKSSSLNDRHNIKWEKAAWEVQEQVKLSVSLHLKVWGALVPPSRVGTSAPSQQHRCSWKGPQASSKGLNWSSIVDLLGGGGLFGGFNFSFLLQQQPVPLHMVPRHCCLILTSAPGSAWAVGGLLQTSIELVTVGKGKKREIVRIPDASQHRDTLCACVGSQKPSWDATAFPIRHPGRTIEASMPAHQNIALHLCHTQKAISGFWIMSSFGFWIMSSSLWWWGRKRWILRPKHFPHK